MSLQTLEAIKPGEWHDVLWHQYMNCVDSLRIQNTETSGPPVQGLQGFKSHPSWETFEGNVRILEAMCQGYDLIDKDYKPKEPNATVIFAALTSLLKRKKIWREGREDLGRL